MNKLNKFLKMAVLLVIIGVTSSCDNISQCTEEYIEEGLKSGELTKLVIDSAYFDKIDAGSKFYIEYSQSNDAPCVEAIVKTDVMSALDIRVQDSTLIAKIADCDSIGMNKKTFDSILWENKNMVLLIKCNSPNLHSVHTINNPIVKIASLFKTDKLDVDMEIGGKFKNDATLKIKELNIKTSGYVNIFGMVDTANILVLGRGCIDSPGLDIDNLNMDISTDDNGKDCKVGTVNKTLNLLIVGTTTFTYKGNPTIINNFVDETSKVINE